MRVLAHLVTILVAVAAAAGSVLASDRAHIVTPTANEDTYLAISMAPIRSGEQLSEYIRDTASGTSPLNRLRPSQLSEFLHSLSFNENGLTSFNYLVLRELTVSEAYRILALFGAQHLTPIVGARQETELDTSLQQKGAVSSAMAGDYQDYKCSDRATCARAMSYICMSSC